MIFRSLIAVLAVVASLLGGAAHAQPFPSKPLKLVVPFPPGGAADLSGRLLAEHLAKGLGQPVVIENRPGGSTIIGAELVLRSPHDGYTIFIVFPSFIVNPLLRSNMSFHPLKDFRAIGQTLAVSMVIAAHPSLPANNLKELIALARAKPGEISYGTPGLGTTHHVMGELLKLTTKINLTHAPFQGGGPSLAAVTGGHIQLVYGNANEIVPSAKSGKVKPIVVTSAERVDLLPETMTMKESGFPELEATNWSGFVVLTATPPAVVARLNKELVAALATAEVQSKFKGFGMLPAPGTPEQFDAFLKSESALYARVVKEAGVKAE